MYTEKSEEPHGAGKEVENHSAYGDTWSLFLGGQMAECPGNRLPGRTTRLPLWLRFPVCGKGVVATLVSLLQELNATMRGQGSAE